MEHVFSLDSRVEAAALPFQFVMVSVALKCARRHVGALRARSRASAPDLVCVLYVKDGQYGHQDSSEAKT
jgi:hypothetical protein